MDETLRKQVYRNLQSEETDELLRIWREHDVDAWDEETFKIIKEILLKRKVEIPPLAPETQVKRLLTNVQNYLRSKNYALALAEVEEAIRIKPDSAQAYHQRGLIYDEMGDLEKAVADYQKVTQLDPSFTEAWQNLDSIEKEIEDNFYVSPEKEHLDRALDYLYDDLPAKAITEISLAKENLPEISPAYNYLGLILEELGDLEAAQDAYQKAIKLNTQFHPAWVNFKNIRLKQEENFILRLYKNPPVNTGAEFPPLPALSEEEEIAFLAEAEPLPGWVYLDEKAYFLRGYPGYRTYPGRNIYDPLNSDFELAHIEGSVLHSLLTFKFKTHNPFYLALLAFFGMAFLFPAIMTITSLSDKSQHAFSLFIVFAPYTLLGLLLWSNILASLLSLKTENHHDNGKPFF